MSSNIAVPTFQKGELFFRQRDLEKWIVDYLAKLPGAPPADVLDGTILLKAIEAQHSILVERAQGIYSFSHLTFQEYLTARYLVENQGKEETNAVLRRHLIDRRWHEVFLLTASLLDNAEAFVTLLRQAIDKIVASEPILIQLLTWAQERTQAANTPVERRPAVQLAYIFLALALHRFLALALVLVRALAGKNVNESTLILARESALELACALDQDLASELVRVLASEFVSERDLALASATTLLTGFDYGLYYAWFYATIFSNESLDRTDRDWQAAMQAMLSLMTGLAGLAEEGGLPALAQQLFTPALPAPTADGQAWQRYADALFVLLRDERDLARDWAFTDEAIYKLNDYFYANELLVECLKVAAVSDRQTILNGLLLPPNTTEQARKTRSQGDRKRRR